MRFTYLHTWTIWKPLAVLLCSSVTKTTSAFRINQYRRCCVYRTKKGKLPKRNAPSSGAGCCEARWHGHAKSSFGRAGSCGTVGTGTGSPSCSHSGNRNTPQDGRLGEDAEGNGKNENKKTLRKLQSLHFVKASKKNQTNHNPGSQSLKEIITASTPWLLSPEEIILEE